MEKKSFASAMSATFRQPNETTGDFMRQFKSLSQEDREGYSKAMLEAGIDHEPPIKSN